MANRRCEQVINPFSFSEKRKANGIRCTIQLYLFYLRQGTFTTILLFKMLDQYRIPGIECSDQMMLQHSVSRVSYQVS